MTNRKYFLILFRLSIVITIATGIYTSAVHYFSFKKAEEEHYVEIKQTSDIMNCASKIEKNDLKKYENRYGLININEPCSYYVNNEDYTVSYEEIKDFESGTFFETRYSKPVFNPIPIYENMSISFLGINLLGLLIFIFFEISKKTIKWVFK